MKKSLLSLLTIVFLSCFIISCEKEDEVKDTAKEITSFTLLGKSGSIDKVARTITLPEFPYSKYDELKATTPGIEYLGMSVFPSPSTVKDFTKPVSYWVTAENETTLEYTIKVNIGVNNVAEITSYKVYNNESVYTGVVDNKTRKVTIEIPFSLNGSKLRTVVNVSDQASIPGSFNNVTYKEGEDIKLEVTAGDGSVKTYTVVVKLGKNTVSAITSLSFKVGGKTYNSVIDEENREIRVSLPNSVNMENLQFTVEKAIGTTIIFPEALNNGSGKADFSEVEEIKITSESGENKKYEFLVEILSEDK